MEQATQVVGSELSWFISLGILFLFGVGILLVRSRKVALKEGAVDLALKPIQVPKQNSAALYLHDLLRQHGVPEVTTQTRIPDYLVQDVLIAVTFKYGDGRAMHANIPCTVGDILRQLE